MKNLITTCIILTIFMPFGSNGSDSSNFQNYMKKKCDFVSSKVTVCKISMARLYSSGKYFSGRNIQIFGYMAIDNGELALFRDKLSYMYGVNDNSIVIDAPYKYKKSIASKWNKSYVFVTGRFTVSAEHAERLGVLSNIKYIFEPGVRPKVKEDNQLYIRERRQAKKH